MNGIRFYLEYKTPKDKRNSSIRDNRLGNHQGNVIALLVDNGYWISQGQVIMESISALNFQPDSVVCDSQVSQGYLDENCKRISEKLARLIHPNLFQCLDN